MVSPIMPFDRSIAVMKDQDYPVLPKWPFVAGDILLLGLAVLVAVLSPKPYSAIATSFIIITGALAALLLLAPFIVEYLTRLQMTNLHLQATVVEQSDRCEQLIDELGGIAHTLTDLAQKSAQSAEDLRVIASTLQEAPGGVDEALERALQERETEFVRCMAELRNTQGRELENLSTLIAGVQEEVSNLLERAATSNSHTDRRLDTLADKLDALMQAATADPLESKPPAELELDVAPEEEIQVETLDEADTEGEDDEPKAGVEAATDDPEIVQDVPVEVVEEISLDEFEEESPLEPQLPTEAPTLTRSAAEDPASLTLIANLNVGIGNAPYVRGEGQGLSWTHGVPMSFVEIGKWEWKVEDADEPAWVRIFKNDKVSAYGDDIEIGVGEIVEVYPQFPDSPEPENVDLDD